MRHNVAPSRSSGDDLVDGHSREILAMPDGALVLLLALELEHQRFFAAAMRGDGAFDHGSSHVRAGFDRIALDQCDHARKFNSRADIAGDGLYLDRLARG